MEKLKKANELIGLLKDRGYNTRDRLFRKLSEEVGEYAEAIEFANGATRKVAKFGGKFTPQEKLQEEIADVIMVALALARIEGMRVEDILDTINFKLGERESEYQRSLYEEEQEYLYQRYLENSQFWRECPKCQRAMFAPIRARSIGENVKEEDGPWFSNTDRMQCKFCNNISFIQINEDGKDVVFTDYTTEWEE